MSNFRLKIDTGESTTSVSPETNERERGWVYEKDDAQKKLSLYILIPAAVLDKDENLKLEIGKLFYTAICEVLEREKFKIRCPNIFRAAAKTTYFGEAADSAGKEVIPETEVSFMYFEANPVFFEGTHQFIMTRLERLHKVLEPLTDLVKTIIKDPDKARAVLGSVERGDEAMAR